jgi:3-oxoacyl-[acyl-carrier-protein] synthase II
VSRRVVITAVNTVTALGLDLEATWQGLVAGRSGVKRITLFDPSDFGTQIAAQVPDEFEEYVRKYCHKRMLKQTARGTALGLACAKAAIERSEIDFTRLDQSRCGVVFGAADTGHSRIYEQDFWVLKTMPHAVPALLSLEYGLQGPSLLMSSACASSAYAICVAHDLIAHGQADVVIAGGCSSIINPEHIRGFNELRAISTLNETPTAASKPFSLGRDGFVIGEGAGVLLLESLESAQSRGARIFGEVLGHAMTNEAFNLMCPRADGAGMLHAMRSALRSAGVAPEQVDYINAHGTSTPLNDKCETAAIKQLFGERAAQVPVSASKSMIGHTAGACGAVEAAITVWSLYQGIIPPTINYVPDPELDLDYVPHAARRSDLRVAVSNSFGFGGCNASIVFGLPAGLRASDQKREVSA